MITRQQYRKQRILDRIKQNQQSEQERNQRALEKIREIRSRLRSPA